MKRASTFRVTWELLTPVEASKRMKPKPRAMRRLKIGAAKQAVMAMLLSPFRAIEVLVEKSPTEFPQANTVRPSTS